MSNAWFRHGLRLVAPAAVAVALAATSAAAGPRPGAPRALKLFSGFLGRQNANRWDCGLDANGHVCVDPNGSTTVGGGFWPKGTPDQYVFGSGLQVSGVIGGTKTAQFSWPGDTSAAFFEDPSGTHENGQSLTGIWNSGNATDLANWPRDAYVPDDASLYAGGLIGRKAASQMDTWVRYWDGSPSKNAGRPHPLGILVDERGLSWNFPSGNEDVVFFIYTFTNITAKDPAVYAGRPDQDSLVAWGNRFQAANEQAFGIQIPDTGYEIDNAFAAFAMDADVSDQAKQNFTTAFLPFNMGIALKSNWFAPRFIYPSTIFSPPFAPTVGEVGVKYLKSPLVDPADPSKGEIGLVLYSGTVNGGAFGDAANAAQVYRYMNGDLRASLGDAACNYPKGPAQKPGDVHVCYIPTTPDDIRFFQSSGPFTLKPGKTQTIVVAYIAAAPVDNVVLKNRSDSYIFPVGGPFPAQPESLAAGRDTLRTVDRIFGATGLLGDLNGNGRIDQTEVQTVDRSLLGKGLVAQAVFDSKFLLPFPPDAPEFFLVPGDNQVTVVWRTSTSETTPDPYYAVASNPASGKLYDQDYRPLDVQGYRIYRGRTSGDMQVIAQFDKAGEEFIDFTAELNYGNCAPELGVTTDCPADLATGHHVAIASPFVQIPPGGRVQLSSGTILIIQADTAVTGGGSNNACVKRSSVGTPCQPLGNTGVPFAFVDNGVRNGFTYFYTVAAFDINSVKSTGLNFTSLEGSVPPKTVVPRKAGTNVSRTAVTAVVLGDDGTVLDPATPYPSIDADKGTFSGNMPPVNGFTVVPAAVSELVRSGIDAKVVVDSVSGGAANGIAGGPTAYVRFIGARGDTLKVTIPALEPDFSASPGAAATFSAAASVAPYDTTLGKRLFGIAGAFSNATRIPVAFSGQTVPISQTSSGIAMTTGRYDAGDEASRYLAHSRWFDEAGQEPADPTISGYPDTSHNSGHLTGVGRIWSPQAYRDRLPVPGTNADPAGPLGAVNRFLRGYSFVQVNWYPADFVVTWNSDSSISVRDVTHHVNLPTAPHGGAGWGFINVRAYAPAGIAAGDLDDGTGATNLNALSYHHLYGTPMLCSAYWGINCITFESKAELDTLDLNYNGVPDSVAGKPVTGIGLTINGEAFIMELNAIPTAGTKWHLRAVTGIETATCTPSLGPLMTDCSGYKFTGFATRQPLVPNLTLAYQVTQQYTNDTLKGGNLAKVHTVPDPYYVTNAFEQTTTSKVLRFVNLPSRCILRIYSLSGVLVQVIPFNDQSGGGETQWNLRSRNNQVVASGVYFYHVETPDGKTKIGRFTIVNFAQ